MKNCLREGGCYKREVTERFRQQLWEIGRSTIGELESESGILASARGEAYGCIFGRDSLITAMQLMRAYEKTRDPSLSALVRNALVHLCALQGARLTVESGEEPGKCIHEFRPTGHEHLTERHPAMRDPWYVYPDGVMRNYDSVDATPLLLVALAEYIRLHPHDESFKDHIELHARLALAWLDEWGDSDGDGLIDYRFREDRRHGGLRTQSWMDSTESLFHDDGTPFRYPIAPLEVQAYAYRALRAWADLLAPRDGDFSMRLTIRANRLKDRFNARFVLGSAVGITLAFAIDGSGKAMSAARSSMGHVLWAAWRSGGAIDCVLDERHIGFVVERLMQPDLFVPRAGFRTLSSASPSYDPMSYHNGTIWPHDTALIEAGMRDFGYAREADAARDALLLAYDHFRTPIELFAYTDDFAEYETASGHRACRKQAWSAASLLALLA